MTLKINLKKKTRKFYLGTNYRTPRRTDSPFQQVVKTHRNIGTFWKKYEIEAPISENDHDLILTRWNKPLIYEKTLKSGKKKCVACCPIRWFVRSDRNETPSFNSRSDPDNKKNHLNYYFLRRKKNKFSAKLYDISGETWRGAARFDAVAQGCPRRNSSLLQNNNHHF